MTAETDCGRRATQDQPPVDAFCLAGLVRKTNERPPLLRVDVPRDTEQGLPPSCVRQSWMGQLPFASTPTLLVTSRRDVWHVFAALRRHFSRRCGSERKDGKKMLCCYRH